MPGATPVAVPVDGSMVAMVTLLLLQVPPMVASVNEVVDPTHTAAPAGNMATGVMLTVTSLVAEQPEAVVYDMVAAPALIPVTVPEVPTLAMPGLPLLQVPPGVASASDAVPPTQMLMGVAGVIDDGFGLTVRVDITKHEPTEYVIVTLPADTPVAVPLEEPIVATAVLLLTQAPAPVASVNVVEAPWQIEADDGDIDATVAITVTIFDAAQLPIE